MASSSKSFQSQASVRSICVIAHVDHGKTSYCDSLLSANNIISSRLAGSLRFLDSRTDEIERGITMESSAVSLSFAMLSKRKKEKLPEDVGSPDEIVEERKDYMINLIDTPGHVDFSSEVSTASRLCDGALVLVDAVEGVCTQTISVLRQAWKDRLRPILVINKIDRLIVELKLSPSEAYHHLSQLIEGVNAIMGGFYASERMMDDERWRDERDRRLAEKKERGANEAEASLSTSATDTEDEAEFEFEEKDDEDIYFDPGRGNVIFASAIDGWAFRVGRFAQLYAAKLKIEEKKLRKVLWGDFYLDPKSKRVVSHKKLAGRNLKPLFVQFVLDNIWGVYENVLVNHDPEKVTKIISTLGVKIHPRDLRAKETRPLLAQIFQQWLPLSTTTFQAVVDVIPPPKVAQSTRVPKMLYPDASYSTTDIQPTNKLETDLYSCNAEPDSNVVVYVSKMFAVKKEELPENRVKAITADDMRKKGQEARERRAAAAAALSAAGGEREDEELVKAAGLLSLAGPIQPAAPEASAPPEPATETSEVTGDSQSEEALIGFARLYSGTLKVNTTLRCLLPKYNTSLPPSHPNNSKYITSITIKSLYMMMGRDLVLVDEVPAGNIFAINGLEGKVFRNATLFAPNSDGVALNDLDNTEKRDDDLKESVNLAGVIMQSAPIVRVALEPLNPSELPKLVEGLKLLNQADPCVETLIQDTGEHVILTAGELHLERCLKDLRERFAKIEIQASKPIVPFRETAVKGIDMAPPKNKDAPRGTVHGSSSGSLVNFTIRAVPLPKKITAFLQTNIATIHRIQLDKKQQRIDGEDDQDTVQQLTTSTADANKLVAVRPEDFWAALDKLCKSIGGEWSGLADKIHAFGPKRVGPNVLIETRESSSKSSLRKKYEAAEDLEATEYISLTEDSRMNRDFDDSIETGFQIATFKGPLCAEPVVGMAYFVEKVETAEGQTQEILAKLAQITGSLISAVTESCRAGLLDWSPRIMMAMYISDIQASTEVLGKVYAVVAKRRGKIVSEEMKEGTSFFTIQALLPVVESFGFADEIRKRSSGAASPQLVFSGFELLDQDPFWVPTTEEELEDLGDKADRANIAKVYVDAVRTRKGMHVEKKIVEFAQKQRTLKK